MLRVATTATRRSTLAGVVAVTLVSVAGCGGPTAGPPAASSAAPTDARHGPHFPLCGGIGDDAVAELTGTRGLINTGQNPTGCQWLVGGVSWPRVTFAWYRGSPIGRERKVEEMSRTRTEDVTIDGRDGFIGVAHNARLGDFICEVAVGFDDDFIEWSVSFDRKPFPDPCQLAEELTRRSLANAH